MKRSKSYHLAVLLFALALAAAVLLSLGNSLSSLAEKQPASQLSVGSFRESVCSEISFAWTDDHIRGQTGGWGGGYRPDLNFLDLDGTVAYCLSRDLGNPELASYRQTDFDAGTYTQPQREAVYRVLDAGYPARRAHWSAQGLSEADMRGVTQLAIWRVLSALGHEDNTRITGFSARSWQSWYDEVNENAPGTAWHNVLTQMLEESPASPRDGRAIPVLEALVSYGLNGGKNPAGDPVSEPKVKARGTEAEGGTATVIFSVDASGLSGWTYEVKGAPEGARLTLDGKEADLAGECAKAGKHEVRITFAAQEAELTLIAGGLAWTPQASLVFYTKEDASVNAQEMGLVREDVAAKVGSASAKQKVQGGTLLLRKECAAACAEEIAGNPLYSLEGARYGVYAEKACETLLETLETDASGKAQGSRIYAAGADIWLKELQAPRGYRKSEEVIGHTVTAGENAVAAADVPVFDPMRVRLYKTDASWEPVPGTAVFRAEFFASEEPSGEPARTWFVRAEAGALMIAPEYLAEGYESDPFFTTPAGEVSLPLGSLRLTEIEPPQGYIAADEVIEAAIVYDEEKGSASFVWRSPAGGMLSYDAEGTALYKNHVILRTNSSDAVTGTGAGRALSGAAVTDVVTYEGLVPGRTYVLRAELVDTRTGKPVPKEDGSPAKAKKTFVPKESSGSVTVKIPFDGAACAGARIVTYETLYSEDGTELGSHRDPDDPAQSLWIPSLDTEVFCEETGTHMGALGEQVTLTDHVRLTGLRPGVTYTVQGILINKATGEPAAPGAAAEAVFTAKKEKQEIRMTYTVDASRLAGVRAVVFADLLCGGHVIAEHHDPEDADQTVIFPEIGTVLKNGSGDRAPIAYGEEAEAVDTVTHRGLIPGRTYVLRGILMDRETGAPVNIGGKTVTAERVFTAASEDGAQEMTFRLDTREIAGRSVVAFERLYLLPEEAAAEGGETASGSDGPAAGETVPGDVPAYDESALVLIAVHENLSDPEQTLEVETPPEVPEETPEVPEETPPAPTPEVPTEEPPRTPGADTGDPSGLWAFLTAAAAALCVLFAGLLLRQRGR